MTQAQLLIVNTIATLARMALTVGLGLLTTRIAYQQLGEAAFGVYVVVVGVTSMLMIAIDSLSSSAQRYLAHAIGAGDPQRVAEIAGSFVTLAGLGAVATGVTGVLASGWIADRIQADGVSERALPWAVCWVIAAVSITVLQAPYRAYLVAKQSIVLVTALEVLDSMAAFVAAAMLLVLPSRSIVDLAFYTFVLRGLPTAATIALCLWRFPELRPGRPTGVREHLRFASWIAVGATAWRLRTQGVQIAMNALAGPIASAAYGVSLQLAMYQNNLSAAVYRAARPAAIAAHGRNSTDHVRRIALGASKVMGLGNLLLAVPLLFETEGLLTRWLGIDSAPADMVAMARGVVLWISLRDLSIGHEMAIHATGRLARHEAYVLAIDAISVALGCYAVYRLDSPPWLVYAVLLGTVAQTVMRVGLFSRAVGTTPIGWLRDVLLGYGSVAAISGGTAAAILAILPPSGFRIAAVVGVCALATTAAAYRIGLNPDERSQLRAAAGALVARLAPQRSQGGSL